MPRSFLVRKCLDSKLSSSSAAENLRLISSRGTSAIENYNPSNLNASKKNLSVGETGGILDGRRVNLNRGRRLASFGESFARETEAEKTGIPRKPDPELERSETRRDPNASNHKEPEQASRQQDENKNFSILVEQENKDIGETGRLNNDDDDDEKFVKQSLVKQPREHRQRKPVDGEERWREGEREKRKGVQQNMERMEKSSDHVKKSGENGNLSYGNELRSFDKWRMYQMRWSDRGSGSCRPSYGRGFDHSSRRLPPIPLSFCPVVLHSTLPPKPLRLAASISGHVTSFPVQSIHLERSTVFTVSSASSQEDGFFPAIHHRHHHHRNPSSSMCHFHELLGQPCSSFQRDEFFHNHHQVQSRSSFPCSAVLRDRQVVVPPEVRRFQEETGSGILSPDDAAAKNWKATEFRQVRTSSYRQGQFSNWLIDCQLDSSDGNNKAIEGQSDLEKFKVTAELEEGHGRSRSMSFQKTIPHEKRFTCKHCDKLYTSLGALKMHIRTHTLPCKCVLCGKAFSRPWLLQGHVRTHTGEKPFRCPQCGRAFADRSNLRAHLQTHARFKKYCCSSCPKTFSRLSLLLKHQENCTCCRNFRVPPTNAAMTYD